MPHKSRASRSAVFLENQKDQFSHKVEVLYVYSLWKVFCFNAYFISFGQVWLWKIFSLVNGMPVGCSSEIFLRLTAKREVQICIWFEFEKIWLANVNLITMADVHKICWSVCILSGAINLKEVLEAELMFHLHFIDFLYVPVDCKEITEMQTALYFVVYIVNCRSSHSCFAVCWCNY